MYHISYVLWVHIACWQTILAMPVYPASFKDIQRFTSDLQRFQLKQMTEHMQSFSKTKCMCRMNFPSSCQVFAWSSGPRHCRVGLPPFEADILALSHSVQREIMSWVTDRRSCLSHASPKVSYRCGWKNNCNISFSPSVKANRSL